MRCEPQDGVAVFPSALELFWPEIDEERAWNRLKVNALVEQRLTDCGLALHPDKTKKGKGGDYDVGYGKPPMQRRFKSGESGNRRGRPHGSKNRKTMLREIANEMHWVTEDGQRRRRSTLELMLLAFRNRAAEGNVRAFRAYEKFLAKYEPQKTGSEPGYLVVPAPITPEEAIAEGEKANAEARARREAQSRE